MPSYGQPVTIQYSAINISTNLPATGDAGNHTLRWIQDGSIDATIPVGSEISVSLVPGMYQATLTVPQSRCQIGTLGGKSSTANVSIVPTTVGFENLPTGVIGSADGLPYIGGSNGFTASLTGFAPNNFISPGSFQNAVRVSVTGNVSTNPVTLGSGAWDSIMIENNVNARQALSAMSAVIAGSSTVAGNNIVYFALNNNTITRVTSTAISGARNAIVVLLP